MGDNYISYKEGNGSINISEEVISTMVRTAITEIDGVASISNTVGSELAELIGIKSTSKGIKVEIVDDTIKVDAVILVKYGCNIINVAKNVQDSVMCAKVECPIILRQKIMNRIFDNLLFAF